MKAFTVLEAVAAPMLLANVNTDTIIRAAHSGTTPREQLGRYVFEAIRLREDGSQDPGFILNRPSFQGAQILIAGENFGCGSSRETAVWAMSGAGFRCVIAPSFGGIFHGNCFQNGVLAVQLPLEVVSRLGQAILADPAQARLRVDLERQRVTTAQGETIAFEYDPLRKQALLQGLDDIEMTLRDVASIEAYEALDRQRRPWIQDTGLPPS